MKKIILTVAGFLAFVSGYSQEKGKFRVGLDLGYATPFSTGGGIMFSIEPKYNIEENMNVGLRIGGASMSRDVKTNENTISGNVSANGYYAGTYDYYFNKQEKSFVPYLGAGAGYYSLANLEFDNLSDSNYEVDSKGRIGGFEWGKFRMGVEYNLVPKTVLKNSANVSVGNISNSYLGIHLGFYLGGGKWGNKRSFT